MLPGLGVLPLDLVNCSCMAVVWRTINIQEDASSVSNCSRVELFEKLKCTKNVVGSRRPGSMQCSREEAGQHAVFNHSR